MTRSGQRRIVNRQIVTLSGDTEGDRLDVELTWPSDVDDRADVLPPSRRPPFEKLQEQLRKVKAANALLTAENQALRLMAENAVAREQQRALVAAKAVQQCRGRLAEVFRLASSIAR
jgi:hypothetical protein